MIQRFDGRKANEMRPFRITKNYLQEPEGSVLVEMGKTKVICTVSALYQIPRFIKQEGGKYGWITAEYDMLPRAADKRNIRDRERGKIKGRSHEIQRLIGRTFRAITDLYAFPGRSIYIDCDVIQADGGTRTASINGAFMALYDAFSKMKRENKIKTFPLKKFIGAVSVGVVNGEVLLDLPYKEDENADVDMNIVQDEDGKFIEIQGSGEQATFSRDQLNSMLDFAGKGIKEIVSYQKKLIIKDL